MRSFLKSLFGRGEAPPNDVDSVNRGRASSEASVPETETPEPEVRAPRNLEPAGSVDDILADLIAQVCESMPDPRLPEEIDPALHVYDAGYVTSITAADLLAHIDRRYGLDLSETQLIGPLQNLAALAAHIHENVD